MTTAPKKSGRMPAHIKKAREKFRKLQKDDATLKKLEDTYLKSRKEYDDALLMHLSELATIAHVVGQESEAQRVFLKGMTYDDGGVTAAPLIVVNGSNFLDALIRGAYPSHENRPGSDGKQNRYHYRCFIRLADLEMAGKTTEEIFKWAGKDHDIGNDKMERGLMGAVHRWQHLRKIGNEPAKPAIAPTGAATTSTPPVDDGPDTDDGPDNDADDTTPAPPNVPSPLSIRDGYIRDITKGEQWPDKSAADLTGAKRFALVPVAIEGNNLYVGFDYALCDDMKAFNEFMEQAEKSGQ